MTAQRSLTPLLNPKSIAIVGISPRARTGLGILEKRQKKTARKT